RATTDTPGQRSVGNDERIANHSFAHVWPPPRSPGTVGRHHHGAHDADCGAWVTELLEIGPRDRVLEVGFGPGVIIQRLSKLARDGHVAGIDPSQAMLEQARARNAIGLEDGLVDLRHGSVESLPFDDNTF